MSFSLIEQTQHGLAGEWTVLVVRGCLDHENGPELRGRLTALLLDGPRCLVLDLQWIDALDSSGLGVLVSGLKRTRQANGSLQLVCTQERVLKVLRVTGMTKVFTIHPSVASAIATPTGGCARPA